MQTPPRPMTSPMPSSPDSEDSIRVPAVLVEYHPHIDGVYFFL
jgi:hypothetical protein